MKKLLDLGQLTYELQSILDGLDSNVFVIDDEYQIKRINEPALQLSEKESYKDIMGRKCFEAFFSFKRPCSFCPLTESQELSLQEISINTSSEITVDTRFFRQKIFPVSFDDSKYLFVEILTDISEEKEKESETLRNEKLIALGTAVQAVAHELGNPLMGMKLTVDSLLQQGSSQALEKRLQLLQLDIERASRIVSELRATTTQENYSLIDVELLPVIKEAWQNTKRLYSTTIKLDLEISINRKSTIKADKQKLFQIFENLFKNSFEAFALNLVEKKNIMIRIHNAKKTPHELEAVSGLIEVHFIDNAGGISRPVIGRIFDPFFTTKRFQAATQAQHPEAGGLGLFIVQKIMKEHNGTIEAVSRKPFTRFTLKFIQ